MKTKTNSLILAIAGSAAAAYASTDYGPAIWRPACSGHWYSSGYGHKFHVCHDIEGYYWTCISMFQSCGGTASVHYVTNGKSDNSSDAGPGELTQMVSEANYAWHATCWNQHCTGNEHEGFRSNPAWWTDQLYQASGNCTKHLSDKFGWAKDRNHVVGHDAKSSGAWCSYASANLGINPYCNTHDDPGPYWDWSKYMSIIRGGSTSAAGPDAVSWGAGRVDVLVRGGGNGIYHKWYVAGQGWMPGGYFEEVGGETLGTPTICSWGANRLDAFCWGGNNNLYHKYQATATSWAPDGYWENLGGSLASAPDAVCWGANRIDIVALGGGNSVYHKYWDGGAWAPNGSFENLGGTGVGKPAISSWGANRLDVFIRGTDNNLWHKYFNGSWSGWEKLTSTGNMASAPSAVSWSSGRIDIVYRGSNGHLWQEYFNGSWSTPVDKGWNCTSDPAISSQGASRLDVFFRGGSNASLWHTYYANGTWNGPENLGGTLY